jgi:N-acyl amino acid synthase of PEP-CTERM/exosortase system
LPAIDYRKIDKNDTIYPELFRLRYRVYCDECGYENTEDYPDMMERDEYDEHAIHFCNMIEGHREMGGTVRMILDSEKGFPIEKNFIIEQELLPPFDRNKIAEISRLAISKKFRRRASDGILYSDKIVDITYKNNIYRNERRQNEKSFASGLYRCIYKESLTRGLTHWYAAMSEGLCSLLTSRGCVWHPIGPRMNYHGYRRPYIAVIAENVEAARHNFRLPNPV